MEQPKKQQNDSWSLVFRGNNKIIVIGILITLLFTISAFILFYFANVDYQIRDLVAIFTGGILFTGLFYHAKAISLNYSIHMQALEFDKKSHSDNLKSQLDLEKSKKEHYTHELIKIYHQPEFSRCILKASLVKRNYIEQLKTDTGVEEFKKYLDDHNDCYHAFYTVLNYFEQICLLINKEYVSESILKDYIRFPIVNTYRVLSLYIKNIRVEDGSSKVYSNFEKVAIKWE